MGPAAVVASALPPLVGDAGFLQVGLRSRMRPLGIPPPPKLVESTNLFDLDATPGVI